MIKNLLNWYWRRKEMKDIESYPDHPCYNCGTPGITDDAVCIKCAKKARSLD